MEYKIYTDGATSNNGYESAQGGWAFIVLDEQEKIIWKSVGYVENATNNICELLAVINACECVKQDEDFIIYSDSAYVINCYKQKWYKKWQLNGWRNAKKHPVANKELWERLIVYFDKPNFHFEKVAGHANDKYNNLVDKMAVEAKTILLGETYGRCNNPNL